jgi:AraC-like DNA-binding protein
VREKPTIWKVRGPTSRGASRVSIDAVDRYFRSCVLRGRPPHVSELAERLGVSRGTLIQTLKRLQGVTPAQYFREQRLTKAKHFLRRGWPIDRIVRRAGYGTRRTFFRSFRAAAGKTPAAYRSEQNVISQTAVRAIPLDASSKQNEELPASRQS